VARVEPGSSAARAVDAALEVWRQGDLALSERWFVHVGQGPAGATEHVQLESGADPSAITTEVLGLVVVTQTCDLVRSCVGRPFVEVAPLVELSETDLGVARRGRTPRFFVAARGELETRAIDLDRVMTVEKSVVAGWERTPSGLDDAGLRALQGALARKRARFAFPDDFTRLVAPFGKRLVEKHDRQSEEGRALRALREIRVQATPSWDADEVRLFFWLLREASDALDLRIALDTLHRLVKPLGRFLSVEGQVAALEDLTAQEYVDSDPLDLYHLSRTLD